MAIRVYKPTSPARRFMSVLTFEEITKKKPEKSLIEIKKKNSGRNKQGKITVRHKGGGTRVYYRKIDFKRDKLDIPATVAAIEYDPNRSAFIALLHYVDGEKRYILAPEGLKVGSKVLSSTSADIMPGNALPIENIPVGTLIHNVEIKAGRGGQMVRSAGLSAQLMAKENGYALVRLPSGELRKVPLNAKGNHRCRRQFRSRKHSYRQSRTYPPHGHPPHSPRRRHEPGGSPARRRRRQEPRGYACSCNPVGQGCAGSQDQKAQEVLQ